MSTWISELRARYAVGWVGGAMLLSGCLAPPPEPQAEMTRAALGAGAVTLTAPPGYCIEPASLRRTGGGGGFALLASCESLSGEAGVPVAPALMTVSVLPRDTETPAPVAARLAAAVAPARVGARGEADGMAYTQVLEGGDEVLPGGDPRHWRGARALNDRLVGLAVYVPADSHLAGAGGRRLLAKLAAGLEVRPASGAPPRPDPVGNFLSQVLSGAE